MCAAWTKNTDPALVTAELTSARTISASGQVAWRIGAYEQCITILEAMVVFREKLSYVDRRAIITSAVREIGSHSQIEPRQLLTLISRREGTFVRRTSTKYRLCTSVSLTHLSQPVRFGLNGSTIVLSPKSTRRLRLPPVLSDQETLTSVLLGSPPTTYSRLTVSCSGRSVHEAADRGLESIEELRGILNFGVNRLIARKNSYSRPKPVNEIQLGPVHTLHLPNGAFAVDSFWYEPNFVRAIPLYDSSKGRFRLFDFVRFVIHKLTNHRYGDELRAALQRYARSLDEWDLNHAMVSLWGVMEFLTWTTRASYDITVRRASFVHKDDAFAREVLNRIRERRNEVVHSTERLQEAFALTYELKNMVDALFEFHLTNRHRFGSLCDAAEFLSLPTQSSHLQDMVRKGKMAIKFRA